MTVHHHMEIIAWLYSIITYNLYINYCHLESVTWIHTHNKIITRLSSHNYYFRFLSLLSLHNYHHCHTTIVHHCINIVTCVSLHIAHAITVAKEDCLVYIQTLNMNNAKWSIVHFSCHPAIYMMHTTLCTSKSFVCHNKQQAMSYIKHQSFASHVLSQLYHNIPTLNPVQILMQDTIDPLVGRIS